MPTLPGIFRDMVESDDADQFEVQGADSSERRRIRQG
jgi:hypothetical protein